MCSSSDHGINLCPYYACYIQPNFVSPWDSTDIVVTLPDSSFPLAQSTGLEVGEPFGFDARFSVTDACLESEDTLDEVYNLDKTPLEGSRNMLVHEESTCLGCNNVLLIPLIIPMFPLFVQNPLLPLSITLICPLIILRFMILMLIWAM